ncbi:NAD(P)/FAD-dependent oxidoreductase [Nonomuraea antimicrobica]|uniref:NAD(P)/FAD-dependent oxidoreductase n=1 Tax=Nonomuraea antimicrobica TaxID=561173 RepID=A0ABP7EF60_9ACTN
MSRILIIGGGFAGVWSAAAAARLRREAGASDTDLSITVISPGDDLVIRPRLYERDPDRKRLPLDRILGPIGVDRLAATVTGIDTGRQTVTAVQRDGQTADLPYDRLVLASGSALVRPRIPGAEHLHNVDTLPAAAALESHLQRLPERPVSEGRYTAVVVGAGFTGLEIATELVGRLTEVAAPHGFADRVRVILVERESVVGPDLGAGPRGDILAALAHLRVDQRLGTSVQAVGPSEVVLTDGTTVAAATTVWTAGMKASHLAENIPGHRDQLGRLAVNGHLQVQGVEGVYAAGDIAAARADAERYVMQSCQHASPQGKYAGHNVAADLLGLPLEEFNPGPYITCLDLGGAGAVYTTGWERTVSLTGPEGKERKRLITHQWLNPPVDDAEAILARADFRSSVHSVLSR